MAEDTKYKYMIAAGVLLMIVAIIFADYLFSVLMYFFVIGLISVILGGVLWFLHSQNKKREDKYKDEMLKLINR